MPRYVALLRAINVGGHTVKMDRLAELFRDLGLKDVTTFIASGNVLFNASKSPTTLNASIEAHLEKALGYAVPTFLRNGAGMKRAAENIPWRAEADFGKDARIYVGFLERVPTATETKKVLALTSEVDDFAFHGEEVYWLSRVKMSESKVSGAVLEKALGMKATLRNRNTTEKLAALVRR
jgi:uncharacterized protein (DUF1697 family)